MNAGRGRFQINTKKAFITDSEVKVARSCPTVCDPTDYTVRGILQVRILAWVAVPVSRRSDLPNPGIESKSPTLQTDSLPAEPPGKPALHILDTDLFDKH